MTAPAAPQWQPLLAGGLLAAVLALQPLQYWPGPLFALLLALPPLAMLLIARQLRIAAALYSLLILLAGIALISMRGQGLQAIFWLVAVVVISDVLGYFAGRAFGGPKFWPAISPKKTWSGTVAGWIGALAFGVAVLGFDTASPVVLVIFPLIAFAGQMGDILESWFKRRCGVKDSSNLIPGHGGVLDRFDALLAAAVTLAALAGLLFYSIEG